MTNSAGNTGLSIQEVREIAKREGWNGKVEEQQFFIRRPPANIIAKLPWGYGVDGNLTWKEVVAIVALKRWLEDKDEEAGKMVVKLKEMENRTEEKRRDRAMAIRVQEWKEGRELRVLAAQAASVKKNRKYIDVFAEGFFDEAGKPIVEQEEYEKPNEV
jgi:hypothetical protein